MRQLTNPQRGYAVGKEIIVIPIKLIRVITCRIRIAVEARESDLRFREVISTRPAGDDYSRFIVINAIVTQPLATLGTGIAVCGFEPLLWSLEGALVMMNERVLMKVA